MKSVPKTWTDYPTYKKRFERAQTTILCFGKSKSCSYEFLSKILLSNKVWLMIHIIDYGMGNLGSMRNMFKRIAGVK